MQEGGGEDICINFKVAAPAKGSVMSLLHKRLGGQALSEAPNNSWAAGGCDVQNGGQGVCRRHRGATAGEVRHPHPRERGQGYRGGCHGRRAGGFGGLVVFCTLLCRQPGCLRFCCVMIETRLPGVRKLTGLQLWSLRLASQGNHSLGEALG